MTTLSGVLSAIQTAAGGLSGVKHAPDYPPDKAADFPFVVTYPGPFRASTNTPNDWRVLYNIVVELHVARKDLSSNIENLLDYPELMIAALGGALQTNLYAHDGIEGTFGPLNWGGQETIGFTWTIRDVKIVTTLSS